MQHAGSPPTVGENLNTFCSKVERDPNDKLTVCELVVETFHNGGINGDKVCRFVHVWSRSVPPSLYPLSDPPYMHSFVQETMVKAMRPACFCALRSGSRRSSSRGTLQPAPSKVSGGAVPPAVNAPAARPRPCATAPLVHSMCGLPCILPITPTPQYPQLPYYPYPVCPVALCPSRDAADYEHRYGAVPQDL